jgi:hypothetical protein
LKKKKVFAIFFNLTNLARFLLGEARVARRHKESECRKQGESAKYTALRTEKFKCVFHFESSFAVLVRCGFAAMQYKKADMRLNGHTRGVAGKMMSVTMRCQQIA